MFVLKSLMEVSRALDKLEIRRPGSEIRRFSLFTEDSNYLYVYRVSKDLIDQLQIELLHLLKTTTRRGKGLSAGVKVSVAFLPSRYYIIISK
jgi:hypothetical protein